MFIIVSRLKGYTKLTASASPAIHTNLASARIEASRLARGSQTNEFLIFELLEGHLTQEVPIVTKNYRSS